LKVYFSAGWGAPNSATFAELKSWTEHENPGIRNFSGTATYKKSFNIPRRWLGKDKKIYLDLGNLWSLGEVTLNGWPLSILWKPPYRLEITKATRPGLNRLQIEITNTWANRLVGDTKLPPDQRFCRTNITYSGTPGVAWKDIPLRPSGLMGPVKLIQAVEKIIALTE
jgi:hypothetical protein